MSGKSQRILAPQQIVSCDKTDDGCNGATKIYFSSVLGLLINTTLSGGDPPTAYKYVQKAGGIVSEKTYPYSSGKGKTGKCKKAHLKPKAVQITGFKYATRPARAGANKKPNETKMATAMATNGPLSVCVDASVWQNYKKGVLTKTCKQQLDHCVQAVGYNKKGPKPYWIVRCWFIGHGGTEGAHTGA